MLVVVKLGLHAAAPHPQHTSSNPLQPRRSTIYSTQCYAPASLPATLHHPVLVIVELCLTQLLRITSRLAKTSCNRATAHITAHNATHLRPSPPPSTIQCWS
jgi:hypothetical protein